MIAAADTRAIALFFLFLYMEEKIALRAAHKAVTAIKSRKSPNSELDREDLIAVLNKIYQQDRRHLPRNQSSGFPEGALQLSASVDAAVWNRFHKEASENELVAVTLSRILGFTDQAIAEGLGISLGTARYRIGKGMRQLGINLKRARN